jgi:hypothetical protein
MRYMLIHTDDPSLASGWDDEARASAYSWMEKVIRSGVGLQGSPVRPAADATTIKIRDGELVITDGPYAETKEQIAGYNVLECASMDEAIHVASRHPTARIGTFELRPFWEP